MLSTRYLMRHEFQKRSELKFASRIIPEAKLSGISELLYIALSEAKILVSLIPEAKRSGINETSGGDS